MNIVGVVQARMGSTRLPGKVLMDVAGETMLARTVRRVAKARNISSICVATTLEPEDAAIAAEAEQLGAAVFRGSTTDVLDRYLGAARLREADAVVRITSDCPLIDAGVLSRVVQEFCDAVPPVDYCSNTIRRSYPRGLDTEVIRRSALERAGREAQLAHEREHVTPYLHEHPDRFRLLSVTNGDDWSQLRWTVDVEEDLILVREIYGRLGADGAFGWQDAVELLRREPQLAALNAHVEQKAVRPREVAR